MAVKVKKRLLVDSEHLEQDILDILDAAKLEYDRESLKIDKLTGGISNDIYCVETFTNVKILFRI